MEDKKQHRSDNNDPRQVLKEIDEIARNLLDSGQVLGSGSFSEVKETKLTTSSGPLNLVRGRIRSKDLRGLDQYRTNLIGQINEAKAQIQKLELPLQTNDSKLQTPLQSDPQSVDSNRGENLQETQKAIREKNEQLNAARQSLNKLTEYLKAFEVFFKLNEPLLMAKEKANEEALEKANQHRTNLIGQINEAKAQIQKLELPLQTNDSKLQTPLQSDPQSVDSNRGENLQETQKAIREKNEQLNAARQSLNKLTEHLKAFEFFFKLNEPLLMAKEKANEEALEKANQLLAKNNVRSPFLDFNLAKIGKDRVAMRADNGNLIDYLNKTQLSPEDSKNIIGQLVLGLEALHRHNIVHRDIKLENILVFEDKSVDPPRITVKIADFDSILVANKDGTLPKDTNPFGSIGYMDPQLLTPDPLAAIGGSPNFQPGLISGYKYTGFNHFKADFYSLGQTILHIASRTTENNKQIIDLGRLLSADNPAERPDIAAIKENPYFGESPTARKKFFEDLLSNQNAKGDIKETDRYVKAANTHAKPGDVLDILPTNFQPAYNDFQSLVAQYEFLLDEEISRSTADIVFSSQALLKNSNAFVSTYKEPISPEDFPYNLMRKEMIAWAERYLKNPLKLTQEKKRTPDAKNDRKRQLEEKRLSVKLSKEKSKNPVDDKHPISSRIANEATLNDFRPTTEGATMHELAATAVNLEAKVEDKKEDQSTHAQDSLASTSQEMRTGHLNPLPATPEPATPEPEKEIEPGPDAKLKEKKSVEDFPMEDKKQHRLDNNDPRQVLKEIDEIARNLLDSGQVLGSGSFSEVK